MKTPSLPRNVVCFSVACVDYFPQFDRYVPGGNALNQSIRFQRSGIQASMVGAIGDDPLGDQILRMIEEEGVDGSHLHVVPGPTASNRLRVEANGERHGEQGAWNDGAYGAYRLGSEDWRFLESFDLWSTHADAPDYEEALKRKREHQRMVVDFLHFGDEEKLSRSLEVIDIAYVGGTADMVEMLQGVARRTGGLLVLTLGAEGSLAFHGEQTFRQEALPVDKVMDTTGCGDAFQAAFSRTYLSCHDIPAALLAGAEAGRHATGHVGANSDGRQTCSRMNQGV